MVEVSEDYLGAFGTNLEVIWLALRWKPKTLLEGALEDSPHIWQSLWNLGCLAQGWIIFRSPHLVYVLTKDHLKKIILVNR